MNLCPYGILALVGGGLASWTIILIPQYVVWSWQLPLGTWRRPGQRHGSVTRSSRGVGCIFAHLLLEEFVGRQAFYLAQRLGYIFIAIHMTVWQEWKLPITDVKQWLFNDSVVPQWGCSGLCTLPPQFWHHSLSKECFDMSRFSAAIENILAFFFSLCFTALVSQPLAEVTISSAKECCFPNSFGRIS